VTDSINQLNALARQFVEQRNWQQFQSPKNLSMGMIVEAGELVEHFQWLSEQQSREVDDDKKAQVADELADVLVFLLRIADELNIDLGKSAVDKMLRNEIKYPVSRHADGPVSVKDSTRT
jgi:dCTP diphosphatase